MSRIMTKLIDRKGTSLVELLVAITLTGIITTAILKLYVTQHQNYITQDDITIIQQNARASIDELTRQIRMAGHSLPLGLPALTASNTNPDTIQVTYLGNDCDTYLSAKMPNPSAELKCGSDVSCFYDGQWVYIYDPSAGTGEWFEITHVQTGSFHIQHNTMTLSKAYDEDAVVLALTQAKFFIDSSDPNHPNLMVQYAGRSPQVYAEDVSDLQFAYRLKNGSLVDEPVIVGDVREVLISVTGRSRNPAHEVEHIDYRYRTYRSSVNLRNIGV